jgi:hypothetical protein
LGSGVIRRTEHWEEWHFRKDVDNLLVCQVEQEFADLDNPAGLPAGLRIDTTTPVKKIPCPYIFITLQKC